MQPWKKVKSLSPGGWCYSYPPLFFTFFSNFSQQAHISFIIIMWKYLVLTGFCIDVGEGFTSSGKQRLIESCHLPLLNTLAPLTKPNSSHKLYFPSPYSLCFFKSCLPAILSFAFWSILYFCRGLKISLVKRKEISPIMNCWKTLC